MGKELQAGYNLFDFERSSCEKSCRQDIAPLILRVVVEKQLQAEYSPFDCGGGCGKRVAGKMQIQEVGGGGGGGWGREFQARRDS